MDKKSKNKKKIIKDNNTIQIPPLVDNMEINDIYRFEGNGVNYYIYEGLWDNKKTKWITKTKWDYEIRIYFDGIGYYPVDSKGDFMHILEKDDPNDIEKWNIISR
jgi:hypothetical protein